MHEHIARPKARDEGLVIEELGDELLIYDRQTDAAHCLGAVAAQVFRSCDGERDVTQIGRLVSTPPDERDALVDDAIAELSEKGLLIASTVTGNGRSNGLSRRQVMGRMASIAAAPLIVSVVAPAAQAATSSCQPGLGPTASCNVTDGCCAANSDCRNDRCCITNDNSTTAETNCCSGTQNSANSNCVSCLPDSGTGCTKPNDCCTAAGTGTGTCLGALNTAVRGTCGPCIAISTAQNPTARCRRNNECCVGGSCQGAGAAARCLACVSTAIACTDANGATIAVCCSGTCPAGNSSVCP